MKRWGRRPVGRRALQVMLLLLAVGLVLPLGGTSARAQARSGGTVVMLSGQNIQSINVLFTAAGLALSAAKQVQRGLLFTDDKGAFEGEHAEQVPSVQNGGISADGKTITYKLRKGMTWHDGNPVTSADVQYTWQAIMKPDNKVGTRYGYENITAVDTPDEQTAIVRFKDPFASWAILFDVVMPKHVLSAEADFNTAKFHQMPIGFGPFKITENIKGDHITYEAYPDYCKGRPRSTGSSYGSARAPTRSSTRSRRRKSKPGRRPTAVHPEATPLESQGIPTLVDVTRTPTGTSTTGTTPRCRSSRTQGAEGDRVGDRRKTSSTSSSSA